MVTRLDDAVIEVKVDRAEADRVLDEISQKEGKARQRGRHRSSRPGGGETAGGPTGRGLDRRIGFDPFGAAALATGFKKDFRSSAAFRIARGIAGGIVASKVLGQRDTFSGIGQAAIQRFIESRLAGVQGAAAAAAREEAERVLREDRGNVDVDVITNVRAELAALAEAAKIQADALLFGSSVSLRRLEAYRKGIAQHKAQEEALERYAARERAFARAKTLMGSGLKSGGNRQ